MAGYNVVIPAGTTLAVHNFSIPQGKKALLVGFGFGVNNDTLDVLVSADGGTTFVTVYNSAGVAVKLGASGAAGVQNPLLLEGPGFYQVQRAAGKLDSIGATLVETNAL